MDAQSSMLSSSAQRVSYKRLFMKVQVQTCNFYSHHQTDNDNF